jgi:hypothetical protein
MSGLSKSLASGVAKLRGRIREWDWPMVVIVAGFALAMPWISTLPVLVPWLEPDRQFAAYEKAVSDAALKTPASVVPLHRIETDPALLVRFAVPPVEVGTYKLDKDAWVALPDELKAACANSSDPMRALQQILGLPPTLAPRQLFEITAPRAGIIRPCMSTTDIGVASCDLTMPAPPTAPPADASDAEKKQAADRLAEAFDRLNFVASQLWQSYRRGFKSPWAGPGDYPYTGFPFTGMGWTYDWGPGSRSHIGISEFVIRKGTEVTVKPGIDPETFCAKG